MKKLKIPRNALPMMGLMLLTAILITVSGIIYKQDFWRILPLYVSLIIALLQSRVNRFAPLLGSVNSLLYGLVNFYYTLYASCLYSVLISSPLQAITFIRWNKRAYKETTILRALTNKQRLAIIGGFAICWILMYIALRSLGSDYVLLDITVTILGILATVLMMLSYIEYTVLMVVTSISTLVLYITMIATKPEQITYLIYSVYATTCNTIALFRAKRNYISQQEYINNK